MKFETAVAFAKTHKIAMVFETSAKTGVNVEEVFTCAIKEVFAKKPVKILERGYALDEGKDNAVA